MSDETSQTEETTKKTRQAAEQSRALDTLTDHVAAHSGLPVLFRIWVVGRQLTNVDFKLNYDGLLCRWRKRSWIPLKSTKLCLRLPPLRKQPGKLSDKGNVWQIVRQS